MRRILFALLVLVAIAVGTIWAGNLGYGPLVVNREGELRLILRFGNPVVVLDGPGYAARVPLLDQVRAFDGRFQYLNARPVEMLISRGEKLIIDYYVVWRITDPLVFYQNFPGGIRRAEDRIQEAVNALVGAKLGGLSLSQILARSEIVEALAVESNEAVGGKGVDIVDVRLNRTEIPRAAEPATFEQMREQRRALAREYRARGERNARVIRAGAEREARTIVAKAQSEAEVLRGQGEARSAEIYAEAYQRDPEFYAFLRSLEAYRNSLEEGATLIAPSDHEFFRYLGSDGGRPGR